MHKVMIDTMTVECTDGRTTAITLLNDALGKYLDAITEQGGVIISVQIDIPFATTQHSHKMTWARTHTIIANLPPSFKDPYR